MASNPMQRKANMYLLIGVIVTLLITGSIIGILLMQYFKLKDEIDTEHNNMQEISVLNKNVNSGDKIELSDLTKVKVNKSAAPSDKIATVTDSTISKLNLKAGTVITEDMVYDEGEELTNDVRIQEYNTIVLPSQLEDGQFIDIRLRLPDGTDFIVLPKKRVEIPEINGAYSESTIKLSVTEQERLLMNNAMVDAYITKSSMLYATVYSEAGMQDSAKTTYVPSEIVINLIAGDPNIVDVARNELINKYNNGRDVRGLIDAYKNSNSQSDTDLQSGITEEINKIKQERQNYLQSL